MKNQEQEIWKDIPGYEGQYKVSSLGRVKSLSRISEDVNGRKYTVKERILKPHIDVQDRRALNLRINSKTKSFRTHQLVAMAFLNHAPCGFKLVVDHIDNDRTNNKLSNLQIISHRENTSKDRKRGSSKLLGVSFNKQNNNWLSSIYLNGKSRHLGYFDSEYEAGEAYKKRLLKHLEEEQKLLLDI